MLTSSFGRYITGYNAFKCDFAFKSEAANKIFEIGDWLEKNYEKKGIEVDISDESLSISHNGNQFLLSRQTPNRQLWLASPFTGSHKFDYDDITKKWVYKKETEVELMNILQSEIKQLF